MEITFVYNWILQNKELLKLFYALIIGLICLVIVIKTNRLFHISSHQGIRYFRNAFFFYGLGFIIRFCLGAIYDSFIFSFGTFYISLVEVLFEYCLIMAGFSLFYSLLWKRIESVRKEKYSYSSLFNMKIAVFYLLALIIVALDYLWKTYFFMFGLQIILFMFAGIVSYTNYARDRKKHKFLKLFFVVIILNLFAWILNFLAASFFMWDKVAVINIYILNLVIFFLFLYGIIKVTKKSN